MSSPPRAPGALFAGLCTLDIIQAVASVPGPNEKVTALDKTVAAGGPAANAAVAFAFLGGGATLLAAGAVPVPAVDVADTSGAGDVFHGAFTYAVAEGAAGGTLDEGTFTAALRFAAEVAARSCRTFGTRAWMG